MAEQNPYQAPQARVADVVETRDGNFIPEGRAVSAGRGWNWIAEGWDLFKQTPMIWILLFLLFVVIVIVLSFVPFLGQLALNLLYPVFTAGFLLGCKALHDGGALEVGHLFAGFKQNTGQLILVGLFYLIGIVLIVGVVFVVGGGAVFSAASMGEAGQGLALGAIVFAVLVAMALFIPLIMAIWFAPALVLFHDIAALEAMKKSFFGCLKNILPFLVYGVLVMVLGIIALIPLGLGLLVLAPVIMATYYTSYRDVYIEA